LSHYSGIFFKSGTNELGESGWWKLLGNDPPEILIAKSNTIEIKNIYTYIYLIRNIDSGSLFF